jgi:hypothetical protein
MTDDMNDPLDNLFAGDTGPVRTTPVRETPATATYASPVERFTENCPNCRGSGRFVRGRFSGQCFKCKGTGKMTFKTSDTHRAQQRQARQDRQARAQADNMATFIANFPAEHEWLVKTAPRWSLAADFLAKITQYGDLSPRQMEVITNGMARDAAKAAAVRVAAPTIAVDVSRIEAAFATAKQRAARPGQMGVMIKPLRMTSTEATGSFSIRVRPGSDGSQWEGMLFVKSEDGRKLGSIKGGQFKKFRETTDAEAAAVIECCSNPEAGVLAYAKAYSACGICGRGLLNDKSIARGIGPICAAKFGFNFACEEA